MVSLYLHIGLKSVVKDHSDFYTPAISPGKNEIVLKLLKKDAHVNNI